MTSPSGNTATSRTYRGASAEDRRQERKDRLLEAAFESFARLGIARTTMRDICAQARLTDRYFYEAFGSTEDAFDAVYQWQKTMLLERLGQAMMAAPRNIEAMARAGLRAFYTFIQEDRRRAQVLIDAFSANQQSADKSRKAIEQYVTMVSSLALTIYPSIKPGFNMEMMLSGLVGMAIQVATVWARDGFRQPIDEVIDYNVYAWQGLERWIDRMAAEAGTGPEAQATTASASASKPAKTTKTAKAAAGGGTVKRKRPADPAR